MNTTDNLFPWNKVVPCLVSAVFFCAVGALTAWHFVNGLFIMALLGTCMTSYMVWALMRDVKDLVLCLKK